MWEIYFSSWTVIRKKSPILSSHNAPVQSLICPRCVICMMDFEYGDPIRFLPCLHIYHLDCIDTWLMRSFTCPSCMEPVDAALLATYEAN